MTMSRCIGPVAILAVLFAAPIAAQTTCTTMDVTADHVALRLDCGTVPNCCEKTADLVAWIGARPSSPPLLVDVGPGTFDRLRCGWAFLDPPAPVYRDITFRGSGPMQTVFRGTCGACAGIEVGGECDDLEFKDLSAEGGPYGALWRSDAGDSTWTNTMLFGDKLGWYEFTAALIFPFCDPESLFASHLWVHSRIESRGRNSGQAATGYQANCGSSVLINSDIVSRADTETGDNLSEGMAAIQVGNNIDLGDPGRKGTVVALASTARVEAATYELSPVDGIIAGVRVYPNGTLQMPDGAVSVRVAAENLSTVYGIKSDDAEPGLPAGQTFANGVAFVLSRPGAVTASTTVRVGDTAPPLLLSSYLHPSGDDPPTATPSSQRIDSLPGADIFAATHCSTSVCDGTGQQAHLLISNGACGSGWFDSTEKACLP